VIHGGRAQQPEAPVLEQGDLVSHGDLCRVEAIGRRPGGLAVRGLLGKLDALTHGRRGDLGRRHGLLREGGGGFGGELDGGRETERPFFDDTEPDPQLDVVRRGLEPRVTQSRDLGTDPLDAHLGVLAAERPRPFERGSPDCFERQRQKIGVELHGCHVCRASSAAVGQPTRLDDNRCRGAGSFRTGRRFRLHRSPSPAKRVAVSGRRTACRRAPGGAAAQEP